MKTQWEPGCYSAGPSCLSGQSLVGGVCTCPAGLMKTTTGTGCQAQAPRCLPGQYTDASGRCACPPGQTMVTTGTGCVAAVQQRCYGVQRYENGRCVCGFGERVINYGAGCERTQTQTPTCLSGQTLVAGACTCPPGATVVTYSPGCEYSVPRACNPNLEVRAADGSCSRCPAYQRPEAGVCSSPNCGPSGFLDRNGLCFRCTSGTVATADGRGCRWPGRSLLLGDDVETEATLSEEEAHQFYLDEAKNIKSMTP